MVTWRVIASTKQGVMKQIRQEADAEFAAHARSDLPAALEALEEARQAVRIHIVEMDEVMKGPATRERGMKIAALVSSLQDTILSKEGKSE